MSYLSASAAPAADIVDPDTPREVWDEFLRCRRDALAYRLPDTAIVGIPHEKRRMRKDSTQTLFYGISGQDQWCARLMPAQALVLCLFDGSRTLREVAQALAYLSDCSYEAADLKMRLFLEWMQLGENDWLRVAEGSEGTQRFKSFDFADFCIPASQAKFSTRLDSPISLMIMPTDKCQTDCVYCYACRRPVRNRDFLSLARLHELIDEADAMGVGMVNLDGGDMLCRKGIVEIIAHLCDCDMQITASTKGYVSKPLADRLYAAGLRYIQVGLDAPTAEEADGLVRRKGFFDRTIRSIHNLTEAGITTRTNSIITSATLKLVPELVDFLMTLPLDNIKICPSFRSFHRDGRDLVLTPAQKEALRATMADYVDKYPGRGVNWECSEDVLDMAPRERAQRFEGRPLCSAARTQCIITPDGKVVTCEQSPQDEAFVVGDVTHQSLREVWDSEAMKRFCYMPREAFAGTPCHDCAGFDACVHDRGHCYLDALKAYGRLSAPSPYCPRAPLPAERWN